MIPTIPASDVKYIIDNMPDVASRMSVAVYNAGRKDAKTRLLIDVTCASTSNKSLSELKFKCENDRGNVVTLLDVSRFFILETLHSSNFQTKCVEWTLPLPLLESKDGDFTCADITVKLTEYQLEIENFYGTREELADLIKKNFPGLTNVMRYCKEHCIQVKDSATSTCTTAYF